MLTTGVYTAERASALSGVPKSTIHYWARREYLVPSVSAEKVRLWSFADLMALRTIDWLRQRKTTPDGPDIPKASMAAIKAALKRLAQLELPIWERRERCLLAVDGVGRVYIDGPDGLALPSGQLADRELLRPIQPFLSKGGAHGPDLFRPRPRLRIVPGKLGGSPHVEHTRIETRALSALAESGMSIEQICALYDVTSDDVSDSIDLERQLEKNLLAPAA
jgi:uncharacterized protein (DUF433 family)